MAPCSEVSIFFFTQKLIVKVLRLPATAIVLVNLESEAELNRNDLLSTALSDGVDPPTLKIDIGSNSHSADDQPHTYLCHHYGTQIYLWHSP